MNPQRRTRLALETLEDRAVPAVMAGVFNGDLVLTGAPSAAVVITGSSSTGNGVADTFKVTDGTTVVGTFPGVSRDLSVHFAGGGNVTIDLGGQTSTRNVQVDLGGGNDVFVLTDGTVGGMVKGTIGTVGGPAGDKVVFGGETPLTVNGNANVRLGYGTGDSFELKPQAEVKGWMAVVAAQDIEMDAGSTVDRTVLLVGSKNGMTANVNGSVGIDLIAVSIPNGATAGGSLLVAGSVTGNTYFIGSNQNDNLTISGAVGGNLVTYLGQGSDSADLGGSIGGGVYLDAGRGTDTLSLSGSIGRRVLIVGHGSDTLVVTAGARLVGPVEADLGPGPNEVLIDDAAVFNTMLINGGPGINVFTGNRTRSGLTLNHF